MQRHILYIINPISGTRKKAELRNVIEKETKRKGIPFQIFPSVTNGDYSFLHPTIKDGNITDVVIAGGDGTANHVIRSLKIFNVQFGIIPCGSGNGLAFSAGIPKNIKAALEIIFNGNSNWCDAFVVNHEFACMLCGLGLDAQVAHDFSMGAKRGVTSYIRKTIANFFLAKVYPFNVEISGTQTKVEAYFISVANSNQFGNKFTIAPKASLMDGMLDVVIICKQSKLNALWQTFKQVTGHNKLQQVEMLSEKASVIYFQTPSMQLINPALAPMHIDGEPVGSHKELNFQILPKCFKLICH
ncbi:MAG: YegS/Rv2252/BmrU family lipid kinase [Chitinophagaceae bacterium]|nr:YegS/Rv2252/BmrU family lipid kinase [Chitinophagaceae bacterium]